MSNLNIASTWSNISCILKVCSYICKYVQDLHTLANPRQELDFHCHLWPLLIQGTIDSQPEMVCASIWITLKGLEVMKNNKIRQKYQKKNQTYLSGSILFPIISIRVHHLSLFPLICKVDTFLTSLSPVSVALKTPAQQSTLSNASVPPVVPRRPFCSWIYSSHNVVKSVH